MATKNNGGGQIQNGKSREKAEEETPPVEPNPEVAERKEKVDVSVDDMLDEIDEVLEENAEEFVQAYIQKGGQ